MTDADFFSVFELYKEKFLQQPHPPENKNALDLFHKWLRSDAGLTRVQVRGARAEKIDINSFLTEMITGAKRILAGRGIRIGGFSLGLKVSSKCISVFENNSVYYRIGKTSPRKGLYSGMDLLSLELVMDGNKNNVFIPLLKRQEDLERQLGTKIVRENSKIEATGKYRFKLLFPLESGSVKLVEKYAKILADFIQLTRNELMNLGIR